MSVVRLGLTSSVMAVVAVVLLALAGDPGAGLRTLWAAQELAGTGRPEAVVLALTGLLAWGAWAWGTTGLLLTAAGALPGLPGAVARVLSAVLLPARIRTGAALALGLSLAVAGPAAAAHGTSPPPPDWPPAAEDSAGPPDWPAEATPAGPAGRTAQQQVPHPPTAHVVVAGDCLWRIAEHHLDRRGARAADADVAAAVGEWWSANEAVVGADPDLIHPGQVLQAPPDPDLPGEPR